MGVERSTLATITGREGRRQHGAALDPAVPADARGARSARRPRSSRRCSARASSPACRRSPSATISIAAASGWSWSRSLGLVTMSSLIALGRIDRDVRGRLRRARARRVANYTVAGHTWISHRVAYRWRARSIGIFEISWALALLRRRPDRRRAHQPVRLARSVRRARHRFADRRLRRRLRAPVDAARDPPRTSHSPRGTGDDLHPDGALSDLHAPAAADRSTAWLVVSGSALIALAGISVFVISGSWLDDCLRRLDERHRCGRDGSRRRRTDGQHEHRRVRRSARQGAQHASPGSARSSSGSAS